jgi:hypothetical protein
MVKFTEGLCNAILFVLIFFSISIYFLKHHDLQLDHMDQTRIGSSHFEYLTPLNYLYLRLTMGFVCWSSCLFLLLSPTGLEICTITREKTVNLLLKHHTRFTPFTVWCWTCQAIYFGLSTACTFSVVLKENPMISQKIGLGTFIIPQYLLSLTHILFELSFSVAFLVTIVVTFVLIPQGRKRGQPVENFFKFFSLLFHNANVLFMLIEILTNRIPFIFTHFPFLVAYGLCYVMFSWYWFEKNGIFYYFFLDYDRPYALFWYFGLLTAIGCFFILGYFISLLAATGNVYAYVGIIGFTFYIMKLVNEGERKISQD